MRPLPIPIVEGASRPRQRDADGHPLAARLEAPHNKRMQQTSPPANTFASGLAPDPQRVMPLHITNQTMGLAL